MTDKDFNKKINILIGKIKNELSLVEEWDFSYEKRKGLFSGFLKGHASLTHKEKDIKIIRRECSNDYFWFEYQVILNGETLMLEDLDNDFGNVLDFLSGKTRRENDKLDKQLECFENSDSD